MTYIYRKPTIGNEMDYLTTAQAAQILGITPEGVLSLLRRGQLKAEKVGRDWLYRRADVLRAKERPGRGRPRKKQG